MFASVNDPVALDNPDCPGPTNLTKLFRSVTPTRFTNAAFAVNGSPACDPTDSDSVTLAGAALSTVIVSGFDI